MKKLLMILAIAATCSTACVQENEPGSVNGNKKPVAKLVGNPFGERSEGELLIRLSESAVKSLDEGAFDSERIFEGLESVQMNAIFPGEANATARKYSLHKWYSVSFDSSVSVETAASLLSKHSEIEAIEYNSVLKATFSDESYEYGDDVATKSASRASSDALPFNDMLLKDQWDIINDGTLAGSVAGADVGVKDAWKLTGGDSRVIVAVLDQGISTVHPDLKDALWINKSEANGATGVDDDRNGYIDDINGYNFSENSGQLSCGANSDHGTHVAGTIGATNNNRVGISSIAGGTGKGDGVRLMSCQTFTKPIQTNAEVSQTTPEWIAKAFRYAADNGAAIAQCSYGHTDMEGFSAAEIKDWMDESVEYEALQYFLDPANANCDAVGSNIVVYSAGNYNDPASLWPGAVKECISVTAFCHDYLPGGYTNYGAGCDIAAPGGDIIKEIDNNKETINDLYMILSTGLNRDGTPTFTYKHGTSMACPHVSGVVALGMSYALKIGKKFSRDEFISRLLSSANNMDAYNTSSAMKLWVEQYWDPSAEIWKKEYKNTDIFVKKGKMGAGAVDAWKFLMALEGTPSYMTTPGQKLTIDLAQVFGTDYEKYTLEMSDQAKEALGVTQTPSVVNGIMELTCTKIGAGKISFKASVGKDESGVIPELDYYKEISIVSRPAVASNGGWL